MSEQSNPLAQFSDALSTCVEAMKPRTVAIRLAHGWHLTGILWRPDVIVTSEQSLSKGDEFEVVVAGGSIVSAKVAGRDRGTNVAILRLPAPSPSSAIAASE